jgi:hypothetical protein
MQVKEYKSLGLVVKLNVPSSVVEFDKLAGRDGACLEEAINNIAYRGALAEFRDTLLHGDEEKKLVGLDSITKVERKIKTRNGRDGKVIEEWAESEGDHFKRILEATKQDASNFQPQADKVSAVLVFDPKKAEAKPRGPKKLAQQYKNTASAILKGPHVVKFAKDVKAAIGLDLIVTKDETKDVEAFGWAVKRFEDWKAKRSTASYTGA